MTWNAWKFWQSPDVSVTVNLCQCPCQWIPMACSAVCSSNTHHALLQYFGARQGSIKAITWPWHPGFWMMRQSEMSEHVSWTCSSNTQIWAGPSSAHARWNNRDGASLMLSAYTLVQCILYHTMLLPFCGLRNAPLKSARIGRRFRITSCRTARSRFRTSIQCGWCGCWTLQQIPQMEYHIPKICFPSRAVKDDKGACIFQSIAFEIFPYFRPATVSYCFYKSIIFEMQSASNCSLDFPACTRCWLMPMKHVHTFPRSTAAPHFKSFHHSQMTPGYQVFHQRTYYLANLEHVVRSFWDRGISLLGLLRVLQTPSFQGAGNAVYSVLPGIGQHVICASHEILAKSGGTLWWKGLTAGLLQV